MEMITGKYGRRDGRGGNSCHGALEDNIPTFACGTAWLKFKLDIAECKSDALPETSESEPCRKGNTVTVMVKSIHFWIGVEERD
jgi:hypothetical protein